MDALTVFLTVDVEMWPPGWGADMASHHDAFQRYIHGVGSPRTFGLPYQLDVLADNGLKGIFFVEPLFASVLGRSALEEVVGMIRDAGQDVQLHLHPEWLGRANDPQLPGPYRLAMKDMTQDDQTWLIGLGRRWLEEAGAGPVRAFRAGSFGADQATLRGLVANGIEIDFSQSVAGPHGPISPDWPEDIHRTNAGVIEIPLTTYRDCFGRQRPFQVGSSGYAEAQAVLDGCRASGRRTVVILSHSAELLNGARQSEDKIVNRRFRKLCRLLDKSRHEFPSANTEDISDDLVRDRHSELSPLHIPLASVATRYAEQMLRRFL